MDSTGLHLLSARPSALHSAMQCIQRGKLHWRDENPPLQPKAVKLHASLWPSFPHLWALKELLLYKCILKCELTHWKRPWCCKRLSQEEKGTTEDEMVGWHHWLKGHEFEQAPGDGEGQARLAFCSTWGCKESNTYWATEKQQQQFYVVLTISHMPNYLKCDKHMK